MRGSEGVEMMMREWEREKVIVKGESGRERGR